ncbi:DegT/DnrJ/EryC1/StrS aminotransferase family protein [Bartonella sp. TP]|uniref:DegT/DnrJ/EryC1/StrS family aminotransferase n=1 Tax=Bartonella sp. TP TaxID=3057550 RepID=UPI0025B180C6|nr:DegT/DnrJ/EryC1/StrS aminotransferase family protein [Bartonella sp. TP]MDN5249316.1 DegT/DnrJ/EryC1/StrS aminotransferase family protein [Alphaproteobacteria bacterium]WJW79696.1 DegT/DnrJ/EryC1/StrS aminotransferase family protein [Bartonella sp. TP]
MQFIDLKANLNILKDKIDNAVLDVIASGKYILGPQVQELEQQLASYIGVKHAICCANGTDALLMPLMAHKISKGDCVFCPSFTFAATAEVVVLAGAQPVFVDVEQDTYNIDIASLKEAISMVKREGILRPRAIIAVDLFGVAANYPQLEAIAKEEGLLLIEDAAQAIGGKASGTMCGAFGDIASTSFYPAKPLGCYGDGGAMFTNNDEMAEILRSILFHGKGSSQYDNVRIGLNSRLDTIQAAILLQKLTIFEEEILQRQRVADYYKANLPSCVITQAISNDKRSAYAQYTVKVERRDELKNYLAEHDIPAMIYYNKPLHLQLAYKKYPCVPGGLPVTLGLCDNVLSLPMHPYLQQEDQDKIISSIEKFNG